MDRKSLIRNYKRHLVLAVGKRPSKSKMKKIDGYMNAIHRSLDSASVATIQKVYNEKLIKIWPKVIANEYSYSEMLRFVKEIKLNEDSNLLGIASGLGVFEMFIAKYYLFNGKVHCIDYSNNMNKLGRKIARRLGIKNIKYIFGFASKVPLKSNSQNVIIARRTGLSHSKQWKSVLKEVRRLLKKDSDSRFVYTVKANRFESLEIVKKKLREGGFEFVSSHFFRQTNGVKIAMIIAK